MILKQNATGVLSAKKTHKIYISYLPANECGTFKGVDALLRWTPAVASRAPWRRDNPNLGGGRVAHAHSSNGVNDDDWEGR